MMIIDIRKLNAQKKYVGTMEFEYSAPENLIEIPFVKFSAPVKIRFDYELYEDDAFEIHGTVSYSLEGQCSKCLKAAAMDVEGEINALFEDSKNYEDYSYANGKVDLTQAVEDAIMASMPFLLSCSEECESLSYSDRPDEN